MHEQETLIAPRPRAAATVHAGPAERLVAAANGDPLAAPHMLRNDALLACGLAGTAALLALAGGGGQRPDALGWALLAALHVPLVWRRRHSLIALAGLVCCVATYHALDYNHVAPSPASYVMLYSVAATGRPLRTLLSGAVVLGTSLSVMLMVDTHRAVELLRISGWVVSVLVLGALVRVHRQHVLAMVERAERAERTREEEARRRVAEERLRIARDLHDLLAHSITLIGVQTAVASHVLAADPDRLDREAVAGALDDIAGTCRSARGELRATLEVLRGDWYDEPRGPLPGLDGLPDLAEAARVAGAEVDLSIAAVGVAGAPPAVGAAVYRIVQEALTNAVRHAGPAVTVKVSVEGDAGVGAGRRESALRVSVSDDGRGDGHAGTPGFGLVGMRERVRSVGGTLEAGPGPAGGFAVRAVLPLSGARGTGDAS